MRDLSPTLSSPCRDGIRLVPREEPRDLAAAMNAEHATLCREIANGLSAARSDGGARPLAIARLVDALELHMRVEEDVLHPVLGANPELADAAEVAAVEHRLIRELTRDLTRDDPGALQCRAILEVLGKIVRHHVEEEAYGLLPRLRQADVDLDELARAMHERRRELQDGDRPGDGATGRLPQPRAQRAR